MDKVASVVRIVFWFILLGKWLLECQGTRYRQHYLLLDEERHRLNYFEYIVQRTSLSETWEALPNKKEYLISHGLKSDTFFDGGMACKVKLHIELLRFDVKDVVICLFKDLWEDDEVVEELKVEINGEKLDAKGLYGKVKPVTGYVLYKEASLVTGYIIDSIFYGQVRLLDKFRNHFVVFYIEPFSMGPLYDNKLTEQIIKDKAAGRSPQATSILFEYIAHTEISSRTPNRTKLPYDINFTTPNVDNLTTSSSTPSTPSDDEPSSTTIKLGAFGLHSTTRNPNFHSSTVGPNFRSTTISALHKGARIRSSTMKPAHPRSTTLDPAMKSFHMTTLNRNLIRTTVTPDPNANSSDTTSTTDDIPLGSGSWFDEPESTTVKNAPIKSSTVQPHSHPPAPAMAIKSTTVPSGPSTSPTTSQTTFKSTTVIGGPTTENTHGADQTDESQSQEQVPTKENIAPIGYLVYDIPDNLLQQPNPSPFQQLTDQMLVGYIPYDVVQTNAGFQPYPNPKPNDENDSDEDDENEDNDTTVEETNDVDANSAYVPQSPSNNGGSGTSVLSSVDNSITNNIPINLNIIKMFARNVTKRELRKKVARNSRHKRHQEYVPVIPRPVVRSIQNGNKKVSRQFRKFTRAKRDLANVRPKPLAHVYFSQSSVFDDDDIIEEIIYPKGRQNRGSVDVFNYMREDALLCKLCIWLQPEFANKFGFMHGEHYGAAEIIDIVRYLNWVFRPMDFSMDYKTENVGFRAGHVIVSGIPDIDSISEAQWMDQRAQWGYQVMNALTPKFEPDCCVILAYIYKSMSPYESLSFRRGMCAPDKNLGIITGNFHGHKIAKFDVYRLTAHALGHLMGALNDDDGDVDCQEKNSEPYMNPFIMHATHQLNVGVRPNSMRMSFCSRMKIAVFMGSSFTNCLVSREGPYCGNGILEPGEECDCGAPWQCVYQHQCFGMRDSFSPCKIISKIPGEICSVPSIMDEPP